MWPLFETRDGRSTQMQAIAQIEAGRQLPFGLLSFDQAQGHGQHGRTWLHCGEALALSLAWPGSPHQAGCGPNSPEPHPWPIWISWAVRQALLRRYPDLADGLRLKWPNDLFWRERKLGGVLVQAVRRHGMNWMVVGVGLNGRWTRPIPADLQATDLAQALGSAPRSEDLRQLAQGIAEEVEQLLAGLASGALQPQVLTVTSGRLKP